MSLEDSKAWCHIAAGERRRSRLKDCESMGGRHYWICKQISDLVETIETMPDTPMRHELLNMTALLMRMAVTENGNGERPLSPSKLARF